MPKIDFYVLSQGNINTCFELACRLIEKAYKNRHRIYINVNNQSDAHTLDELLWTYREDSFIPHNLYGEGPEPPPPVQIGFDVTPKRHRDILINISHHIPAFYKQFSRVLELIPNDNHIQEQARENYKSYRTQGHNIQTHKLDSIEI